MHVDLDQDQLISLREAASLLPGKVALSTIHRWRLRGVRGVKLATVMIGGRRYVQRQAIFDFIAAITAAGGKANIPPTLTKSRRRDIERAERMVDQESR